LQQRGEARGRDVGMADAEMSNGGISDIDRTGPAISWRRSLVAAYLLAINCQSAARFTAEAAPQ